MHRPLSHLSFGLLLLFLPLVAVAVSPTGISGVSAERQGSRIIVRWLPSSEPAVYYRIYWSRASILQNEGAYDEFEQTNGSETESALASAPMDHEIFVSVLAVNSEGEESLSFLEEAHVEAQPVSEPLPSPEPPANVPAKLHSENAPVAMPSDREFHILSAKAASPSSIVFTFSHAVTITQEKAPEAVIVTNQAGQLLPGTKLVIEGPVMTLETLQQEPGAAYIARLSGEIKAQMPDGRSPSLNEIERTLLLTGFGAGDPVMETPPPGQVWDIQNLTLRGGRIGNTFSVEAVFQDPNPAGSIAYYEIYQTWDRGATVSSASRVPPGTTEARINGLPYGEYGLIVRAVDTSGKTSKGALATVILGSKQTTSITTGNVQREAPPTSQKPPVIAHPQTKEQSKKEIVKAMPVRTGGGLSKSGGGIAATLAGATCFLVWRKKRNLR